MNGPGTPHEDEVIKQLVTPILDWAAKQIVLLHVHADAELEPMNTESLTNQLYSIRRFLVKLRDYLILLSHNSRSRYSTKIEKAAKDIHAISSTCMSGPVSISGITFCLGDADGALKTLGEMVGVSFDLLKSKAGCDPGEERHVPSGEREV